MAAPPRAETGIRVRSSRQRRGEDGRRFALRGEKEVTLAMAEVRTDTGPTANRDEALGLCPGSDLAAEVHAAPGGREIRVLDLCTELRYRLGPRGVGTRGGFGWTESVGMVGDERDPEPFACAVSEPFAVLAELGRERLVFEMTRDAIRELARGERYARRRARSLLCELEGALAAERVALRRLQAAILARLEDGETPSELAERGGFIDPRGIADTSRLLRRAGLVPTPSSQTGKLRYARTASLEVAAMLCRACDLDPVEVGV